MKLLKIRLDVPFWCSFTEYGTLNLQQTYPFPPPPTLFGMILNAMGKPAVHTVDDEFRKTLEDEYMDAYSGLKFAIIVRERGEKIDDYLNIHKGGRTLEKAEQKFQKEIEAYIKSIKGLNLDSERIEVLSKILNTEEAFKDSYVSARKKMEEASISREHAESIISFITGKWKAISEIKKYELHKPWISTQIHRQRLIKPGFVLYIHSSEDSGEFSLENISNSLRHPKRQLYLGESDDLVDLRIEGDGIVEVDDEETHSSEISSVIPGPKSYSNCEITKIPTKLRSDINQKQKNTCSIPIGKLREDIPCMSVCGENIVFI